jgi:hypothetical protein
MQWVLAVVDRAQGVQPKQIDSNHSIFEKESEIIIGQAQAQQ